MKFKGTKLSNRTVALFAAAILLLSSGGFLGVKAAPLVMGQYYDATLELNSIDVELYKGTSEIENGGDLLALETVEPGRAYDENITVKNTGTAPAYVRLVVRKYWTHEIDGEVVTDTSVDPGLIEVIPTGDWVPNLKEATRERSVYYCTSQVGANKYSAPAIQKVRIKRDIVDAVDIYTSEETLDDGSKLTTKTYTYKYDGYTFHIEAEAQAVQTHNANDAIKSVWGVSNVTESGGKLSVVE